MRAHERCRLEITERMIQNSGTRDEERDEDSLGVVGAGAMPGVYHVLSWCVRECSVSARWVHCAGHQGLKFDVVVVNAWVMVVGAIRPATARDSQEDGPVLVAVAAAASPCALTCVPRLFWRWLMKIVPCAGRDVLRWRLPPIDSSSSKECESVALVTAR